MKPDEETVGRALVNFLGGPPVASMSEGDDPPDLYLSFGGRRVGVEVTRLSQFTIEPDGTLGNRTTQDSFGLGLIADLNFEIGPLVPQDTSLLVVLWLPVKKASRFKNSLINLSAQFAESATIGMREKHEIEGSRVDISGIPLRPSGDKVVGIIANENSSADIGLNARLILEERIRCKTSICKKLEKPLWLAMLNDYWIADADSYELAAKQLRIAHCFERLFLVLDTGAVSELTIAG